MKYKIDIGAVNKKFDVSAGEFFNF